MEIPRDPGGETFNTEETRATDFGWIGLNAADTFPRSAQCANVSAGKI